MKLIYDMPGLCRAHSSMKFWLYSTGCLLSSRVCLPTTSVSLWRESDHALAHTSRESWKTSLSTGSQVCYCAWWMFERGLQKKEDSGRFWVAGWALNFIARNYKLSRKYLFRPHSKHFNTVVQYNQYRPDRWHPMKLCHIITQASEFRNVLDLSMVAITAMTTLNC